MLLSADAVTVTERVEQNNIFQTRGNRGRVGIDI